MACGGCAKRDVVIRRALQDARNGQMQRVAQKAKLVAGSAVKDLRRIVSSPLSGKRG